AKRRPWRLFARDFATILNLSLLLVLLWGVLRWTWPSPPEVPSTFIDSEIGELDVSGSNSWLTPIKDSFSDTGGWIIRVDTPAFPSKSPELDLHVQLEGAKLTFFAFLVHRA